ncbi:t-SNARE, partial [Haematococcus lacustris]
NTRTVEGLLLKLANNVAVLKRHVDVLGSSRDTQAHRARISDTNQTIQGLAQQVKDSLTATHLASSAAAGATPEQQQKHRRLLQDFATTLQDYKATQKLAQEREAAYLPQPSPQAPPPQSAAGGRLGAGGVDSSGGRVEVVIEQQALLQAQAARESAALENAMAHNEALIEERDAGIREITRQIGEVNEMFQDLAVLINDQGVQIQTIDEQITAATERTKDGTQELVTAKRSQRSYQNKCLWLWLIAALLVSVVIVIVFA